MAFGVASSGTSADAASTTIVITAPTGIAVGDYLTAHLTYGKSGGEPTVTPASGFNFVVKANGETNSVHAVYSKVADSGDAAAGTFTFTLSSSQNNRGGMLRITGQKTTTPEDVSNFGFSNSNVFTVTIATVTPSAATSLFIFSGGTISPAQDFSAYAMATDNPSVWTEHIDVVDQPCLFVASAVRITSNATGNITATQSLQDHFAACVFVILPEPVNVTATPAVVTATLSVQDPTVTGGATVSPAVISIASSVQDPTVTIGAQKVFNASKTSASPSNVSKNSAVTPTNVSKNSSSWSNTQKT